MQIQVNTDRHIEGTDDLTAEVESSVRRSLSRFDERITRLEVHLSDLNSEKSGPDDKRCMIEARMAGRDPVAVSHQAATVDAAVSGATARLRRSLESTLGKLSEY
jgi:ribosome-associated translation inhibitor RaiA